MAHKTNPAPVNTSNLKDYFDWVAENDARARRAQRNFHGQITEFFRRHVPEDGRVLECGCGAGDLLRALKPSRGLGIDFSPRMVERARAAGDAANTGCEFRLVDVQETPIDGEKFDFILLSFLTGYLTDVGRTLANLRPAAEARTRLVITSLNNVWLWPLRWAQWLGLVTRQPQSNWLTTDDIVNLLELTGWEVVRSSSMQFMPFELPLLTGFLNRFLARLPVLRWFGITLTIVARPRVAPSFVSGSPSCSVIVPVRNESGNIQAALDRIPTMGAWTEIVFVEGHSSDDTWEVLKRTVNDYTGPHRLRCLQQPGNGKWDAVRAGFAAAAGEILVIQDGDLTAPPEDLPKFFDAIVSGAAEFANGSRLVYPMEDRAMRFLNFVGNKFFALALTHVLEQPVKDSLCGTKMILRSDYERLLRRMEKFGDFDPFGDFNLLFGASLLDLRIRDIPVRYKDRTYGATNISRFSHGWMLLRMVWFGLWRIRWS